MDITDLTTAVFLSFPDGMPISSLPTDKALAKSIAAAVDEGILDIVTNNQETFIIAGPNMTR